MDFALFVSVVLPSFLEEEPDLAFEDDGFEPEALVLLLSPFDKEADIEEPELEPMPEVFWFAPNPLEPPLLLLLLLAVLPEEDEPCAPDRFPEEFIASLEFWSFSVSFIVWSP